MKPFDTYGHHESGKRIKSHDLCYFTLLACVQVVVVERHRANFGLVKKKEKNDTADRWMDGWMGAVYIWGKESQMVGTWLAVLQWWKRVFFFCTVQVLWLMDRMKKYLCFFYLHSILIYRFLGPELLVLHELLHIRSSGWRVHKKGEIKETKDSTKKIRLFCLNVCRFCCVGPVFVYWGDWDSLNAPGWVKANEHAPTDLSHFFLWNKTTRKETTCQYMTLWRRWLFLANITVACRFYLFIWNVNMSIFLYRGPFFLLLFSSKKIVQHPSTIESSRHAFCCVYYTTTTIIQRYPCVYNVVRFSCQVSTLVSSSFRPFVALSLIFYISSLISSQKKNAFLRGLDS